MFLYAPESYWNASQEDRDSICNGCGVNGWKGKLVPDRIYFLNITEACNIHDWMYYEGETIKDKEEADRTFLNNMCRIIDDKTYFSFMTTLRKDRAWIYYLAVHKFGGPAFWDGKNPPESMQELALTTGNADFNLF